MNQRDMATGLILMVLGVGVAYVTIRRLWPLVLLSLFYPWDVCMKSGTTGKTVTHLPPAQAGGTTPPAVTPPAAAGGTGTQPVAGASPSLLTDPFLFNLNPATTPAPTSTPAAPAAASQPIWQWSRLNPFAGIGLGTVGATGVMGVVGNIMTDVEDIIGGAA